MTAILFVCLGNICRSPTAEGVFRSRARQRGLLDQLRVDSAGTGDWHVGAMPDKRAQQAASRRGYDLTFIRARQVCEQDFHQFDYVLAMDQQNLADLKAIQPTDSRAVLSLFLDYAGMPGEAVPDPYYGAGDGFERVLDLVEQACDGLLASLETSP